MISVSQEREEEKMIWWKFPREEMDVTGENGRLKRGRS